MACQVPLALSDLSVPTAQELLEIIDSGTSITTRKHKGIFLHSLRQKFEENGFPTG